MSNMLRDKLQPLGVADAFLCIWRVNMAGSFEICLSMDRMTWQNTRIRLHHQAARSAAYRAGQAQTLACRLNQRVRQKSSEIGIYRHDFHWKTLNIMQHFIRESQQTIIIMAV